MKSHAPLSEVRLEFYDHSEQPLCDGYTSHASVPVPAVGDTFQTTTPRSAEDHPTYVVERRHFHIASGILTARIYGRDVQVTGGL
jgi:hypothetical protein